MYSSIYITEISKSDIDSIVDITKDIFEFSSFRVDKKVLDIVGKENVHKVSLGIIENSTSTFVAVSGNKVLGFLSWVFDGNISGIIFRDYYRIKLFGVAKEHQRKGIGSELLKYFIGYVHRHKGHIIEVSTDVNNIPAIKIYSKFGFFYASSFSTLRLFKEDFRSFYNDEFEVIKVNYDRELGDFLKLRSRNNEFVGYPIQCVFDDRVEDRLKEEILRKYHKSIETNINLFRVYLAYDRVVPIGYGVIKEDFSLSSLLSKIANKYICVYRIFDLFVDKRYRGKGIAKSILSRMIEEIPKPYDFVEVIIPSHNYSAIRVFTDIGFGVSHVMLNYAR